MTLALIFIGVAVFLAWSYGAFSSIARPSLAPRDDGKAPPGMKAADGPAGQAPDNVFIGHAIDSGRKVNTIFTTHKKGILYQALIRYEPTMVGWDEAPGHADLMQLFARQDRPLPPRLKCIEQESEMISDNLGEPLRFVTSIKYYCNPIDGRALGYDMAQTTGGQSQRMVGHLNKNGVSIDIYRGGQFMDRQEISFVRDTWIPIEYEFIHQWYTNPTNAAARATREQIKWSIFVPEAMAQVLLVTRPLEDQRISIGDASYYCARYEVLTVSTQSAEGLYARQDMWFDKDTGRIMRRQDFDATMEQIDAPVTEREPYQRLDELKRMSELPVAPPEVPYKSAEFLANRDYNYHVNAGDKPLGRLKVRYSRIEPGKAPPFVPNGGALPANAAFFSVANVNMDTGGTLRDETAVTLYDSSWNPLGYEARGQEKAGARLNYETSVRIASERISVRSHREPVPELKLAGLHTAALLGAQLGTRAQSAAGEWKDPLRRVPVGDDDASAAEEEKAPRLADQAWTRAFPAGTFISDFNRLEHLALIAARLPLPPPPPPEHPPPLEPLKVGFQKVALYLVRQNRCGVILFETRNEQKPKLTERQKRRLSDEDLNEPSLYVASASAAMMPCRMLLTPDGRILELTMKYGSGDVTYTLDDPIMRRRAERARVQRLQEGPKLVRPPWY